MEIFFLLILLILLIPFLDCQQNGGNHIKSKKLRFSYFVIFFMILIPGLRDVSVGLDTLQYESIYEKYSDSFWTYDTRLEYGYLIINKIVYDCLGSFYWLQIITSMLFVIPLYWLSSRYSSKVWLSLLLFVIYAFYYMCFNEMRQCIAMGVSCFAFNYIVQGDWKKFLIMVALSCCFHHSAAILFPLVFISRFDRLNNWHIVLFFVSFGFISIFVSVIYNFLGSFQEITYGENQTTGGYGLVAMQIMTLIIAFYKRRDLFVDMRNLYSFYYIACAIVIFPICHINPVMFRLEQYLWLPMIILIPNILSSFKDRIIRNLGILAYVVIGYFFLFIFVFSEKNHILPYCFFFNK